MNVPPTSTEMRMCLARPDVGTDAPSSQPNGSQGIILALRDHQQLLIELLEVSICGVPFVANSRPAKYAGKIQVAGGSDRVFAGDLQRREGPGERFTGGYGSGNGCVVRADYLNMGLEA